MANIASPAELPECLTNVTWGGGVLTCMCDVPYGQIKGALHASSQDAATQPQATK